MKKKILNSPKKILIIAPSWVGDMVMAQALFKILKQEHSGVLIDVLASSYLHPLLQRMTHVNHCIELPFSHGALNLLDRYRLGRSLRKEHYDWAIILPNSFKSALIPFWAKIPRRTGWRGEMRYGVVNDLRILHKSQFPQMLERFLALGLNAKQNLPIKNIKRPLPALQTSKRHCQNTLRTLNLTELTTNAKPILALCPGAEYGPAKRWSMEHFATVAKVKNTEGWCVLLLGGHKDKTIAEAIQKATGDVCINLAGKTGLDEVVDLLALATAIITNDSGLMHIAAALNKSMIALYGSSSPKFTPPLSENATILSLHLPCSPCFQRTCPFGHTRCLQDLKVDVVLETLHKIVKRN